MFERHVSITFALCGIIPKSTISVIIPEGQSKESFPTPNGTSSQSALANPRLPSSNYLKILTFCLKVTKYKMLGAESKVSMRNRIIM